jgi:cupin
MIRTVDINGNKFPVLWVKSRIQIIRMMYEIVETVAFACLYSYRCNLGSRLCAGSCSFLVVMLKMLFTHLHIWDPLLSSFTDSTIKCNCSNTIQSCVSFSLSALAGLALLLIGLKPGGVVEPHTHPNAAELNYVINGKVRFTVFDPSGEVETSEVSQGQVFFVPVDIFTI